MSIAEEKRPKPAEGPRQTPMVIGIGASAGGLEALQQFFGYMPPNSGLSFVVVQHLSPDYKSLMADILGKHTEMSVYQAENHMAMEPDTVYLIPPKKYMTVQRGQADPVRRARHPQPPHRRLLSPPWRRRSGSTPSPWSSPAPAPTAPTASRR